jgi:hypothetical protein
MTFHVWTRALFDGLTVESATTVCRREFPDRRHYEAHYLGDTIAVAGRQDDAQRRTVAYSELSATLDDIDFVAATGKLDDIDALEGETPRAPIDAKRIGRIRAAIACLVKHGWLAIERDDGTELVCTLRWPAAARRRLS